MRSSISYSPGLRSTYGQLGPRSRAGVPSEGNEEEQGRVSRRIMGDAMEPGVDGRRERGYREDVEGGVVRRKKGETLLEK
jgi:hypothetical protein